MLAEDAGVGLEVGGVRGFLAEAPMRHIDIEVIERKGCHVWRRRHRTRADVGVHAEREQLLGHAALIQRQLAIELVEDALRQHERLLKFLVRVVEAHAAAVEIAQLETFLTFGCEALPRDLEVELRVARAGCKFTALAEARLVEPADEAEVEDEHRVVSLLYGVLQTLEKHKREAILVRIDVR